MEIYSTHTTFNLVEAYIIETFKACAGDSLYAMVGDEKVLFPSHEEVLTLCIIFKREVGGFRALSKRAPGWKARPMLQINFFRRTPGRMCRSEEVLGPNYFTFKESRESGMVVRKP